MFNSNLLISTDTSWTAGWANQIEDSLGQGETVGYLTASVYAAGIAFAALADAYNYGSKSITCSFACMLRSTGFIGVSLNQPGDFSMRAAAWYVSRLFSHLIMAALAILSLPIAIAAPHLVVKGCDLLGLRQKWNVQIITEIQSIASCDFEEPLPSPTLVRSGMALLRVLGLTVGVASAIFTITGLTWTAYSYSQDILAQDYRSARDFVTLTYAQMHNEIKRYWELLTSTKQRLVEEELARGSSALAIRYGGPQEKYNFANLYRIMLYKQIQTQYLTETYPNSSGQELVPYRQQSYLPNSITIHKKGEDYSAGAVLTQVLPLPSSNIVPIPVPNVMSIKSSHWIMANLTTS